MAEKAKNEEAGTEAAAAAPEPEKPAEKPAPAQKSKGSPALVEVAESFTGRLSRDDPDDTFREGEVVEASHPAVKKWPGYFRDVTLAHPLSKPEVRS